MNRCKGCGNAYRKGRTFHLIGEDGTITPIIGCRDCAKRAVKVVRPIGEAARLCTVCESAAARVCSGCAAKARRQLVAPILAQLAALAKGAEVNGQEERADGMRAAARALEQEVERS